MACGAVRCRAVWCSIAPQCGSPEAASLLGQRGWAGARPARLDCHWDRDCAGASSFSVPWQFSTDPQTGVGSGRAGTGALLGQPPKCHPAAQPRAQAEFCRAGRSAQGCRVPSPHSAGMRCCPRHAAPRSCTDASAGQGRAGSGCSLAVGPCRGAALCLRRGGYRHSATTQEDPASWLTLRRLMEISLLSVLIKIKCNGSSLGSVGEAVHRLSSSSKTQCRNGISSARPYLKHSSPMTDTADN